MEGDVDVVAPQHDDHYDDDGFEAEHEHEHEHEHVEVAAEPVEEMKPVSRTQRSQAAAEPMERVEGSTLKLPQIGGVKKPAEENSVEALKRENEKLREKLREFSRILDDRISEKTKRAGLQDVIHPQRVLSRTSRVGTSFRSHDEELNNAYKLMEIYKRANEDLQAKINKSLNPDRIVALENKMAELNRELDSTKLENKTLRYDNRRLTKELEASAAVQGDLPQKVAKLLEEVKGYKQKLSEINARQYNGEKSQRKRQEYVANLEAKVRELQAKQRDGGRTKTPLAAAQPAADNTEINNLRGELERIKKARADDRVKLNKAEREVAELKETLAKRQPSTAAPTLARQPTTAKPAKLTKSPSQQGKASKAETNTTSAAEAKSNGDSAPQQPATAKDTTSPRSPRSHKTGEDGEYTEDFDIEE